MINTNGDSKKDDHIQQALSLAGLATKTILSEDGISASLSAPDVPSGSPELNNESPGSPELKNLNLPSDSYFTSTPDNNSDFINFDSTQSPINNKNSTKSVNDRLTHGKSDSILDDSLISHNLSISKETDIDSKRSIKTAEPPEHTMSDRQSTQAKMPENDKEAEPMEEKQSLTSEESNGYHHFEQVYDKIKQYGKYQLFTFLLIQYIMLNAAGNYVFISFAALKPQCLIREVNEISDACQRICSCPINDTIRVFDSLYDDHFVCPHSSIPNNLQTLQAVGSGIGALLGGHLADSTGRKWATYLGLLMCFFGFVGGLSPNWIVLAVCMVGMGLAYGVLIDALMTLASETVGPRYRIVQTLAFQWSLAMQLAALIAWLSQYWRSYLLILNGICAPVLLLTLALVESPRWLIQKRRFDEACHSLNTIGKWNGATEKFTADDLIRMHIKTEPKSKIYSMKDLFVGKKRLQYSLVMIFSALTVELCVGVIIFDVQILAGDPFLNVALYGALRLWTPFFVIYAETQNIGRRWLFIASQTFSIVCYSIVITSNLFPLSLGTNILRTIFALLGGIVNSSIFFTVYKQYTIELYPTLMRAIAVGTFGVVERIGGAMAPQLINMNTWAWSGSALSVTTLIMCLSLIAGWAVLPETKDLDMPDVQEDESGKAKSGSV